MFSRRLQDMSSRRLKDIPLRCLQDMSSRRLQDSFNVSTLLLPSRLQGISKAYLQEIFKRSWKTKNCYAEDVWKASSRHVLKTNKCFLETLYFIFIWFWYISFLEVIFCFFYTYAYWRIKCFLPYLFHVGAYISNLLFLYEFFIFFHV